MRSLCRFLVLMLVVDSAFAASAAIYNAKILTLNPDNAEAQAMLWDAHGKIVALGSNADIRKQAADLPQHDAQGAVIIPGLIDAHGHVMNLGYALMQADLVGTESKADVIDRLKQFATTLPADAWLLGRGWDQNDWPHAERKFPSAADLDVAFPTRPVWIERVDGHAGWANSAAMHALGKDLSGDWQVDGGLIVRENQQATGIFVDAAASLIDAIVPPRSAEFKQIALSRALQHAASLGLTGVHDMGVSLSDLQLYRQTADAGKLTLRIVAYANGDNAALDALCAMGSYQHASGLLRMQGVKLYADGALGSRGAALMADYSDDAGNRGLLVTPPAQLKQSMQKARDCGLQVATHAIGDQGNRQVLDFYQELLGANSAAKRWRIEHAQVVAEVDIPRFAQMGVIASMQPTHATSDMPWAEQRVGADRLKGAYAWQKFLQSGAVLPLGSDFPVESADPRLGLFAATTRQDQSGKPKGGWLASQKLTNAQAVNGFTRAAAHAAFMENQVGILRQGMHADFVVLSADPLSAKPQALNQIQVLSTWLDGVRVYSRK